MRRGSVTPLPQFLKFRTDELYKAWKKPEEDKFMQKLRGRVCGEAEEVGKRGEDDGWLEMQMNSPALKATEVHLLLQTPALPSPSVSLCHLRGVV